MTSHKQARTKTLTKPQYELLADICGTPSPVAPSYPPAKKLVEFGYAVWIEKRFSDWLTPTEAGRAALAKTGGA